MRIRSLHVKNFRSIKDAELTLGPLTAFLGKNGSGKSNLLNALDFFYHPPSQLSEADFFAGDVSQDIEIAITFEALDAQEQDFFAKHREGNTLTVTGVFSLHSSSNSVSYHGTTLQNPAFAEVRRVSGRQGQLTKYRELAKSPHYESLPAVRSAGDVQQAMEEWERKHPEDCRRLRDDGHFFGWTGVAQGYLRHYTQLILIPAVRDAGEDATDRRGSAITEIMNLFVRDAFESNTALSDLKERTRAEFSEIMDTQGRPQLQILQRNLTTTLKSYVPDASLQLDWTEPAELTIPTPQASVLLEEDGYATAVGRSGHGLQRALILTLLQELEAVRQVERVSADRSEQVDDSSTDGTEGRSAPSLVLAIEEPELYQHPSRQRHFASVLLSLANGTAAGMSSNIQVVFTTHSPLFVDLERSEQIRVVRKVRERPDAPKATQIHHTTLNLVASQLAELAGKAGEFTATSLRPRLQAIKTPMVNEGFFADLVVLVEGETDRSAILGTATHMDQNFDAEGIAIIPCGGKQELDRPFLIFRNLGIPTYVVWDGDRETEGADPAKNQYILRMLGKDEIEYPQYVDASSACFGNTLESTLECEIGVEIYEESRRQIREQFGLEGGQSTKNPLVVRRTVELAAERGAESQTVKEIVEHVIKLKESSQP